MRLSISLITRNLNIAIEKKRVSEGRAIVDVFVSVLDEKKKNVRLKNVLQSTFDNSKNKRNNNNNRIMQRSAHHTV